MKRSDVVCGIFVALLLIAAVVLLACSYGIPGFLKPDKEVPFLGVDALGDGTLRLDFVWEKNAESLYISPNRVSVSLRSDGKSYTTLLLQDRKFSDDYHCNSVMILVPYREDLDKWERFLAERRERLEPRRVLP